MLENGIKLYIGESIMMPLPRILEIAAAALTGIGPEGDHFLAAVKSPGLETREDNMVSQAESELNIGMYGVAIEASRDEGQTILKLSASLPFSDIKQLINAGKIV